jgi:hypothetical protein
MEILIVAISNILCFIVGARIGQKVNRGEEVKLPNPITAVKEHKKRTETEEEQNRLNAILENIERYDGTSIGQKQIPRR